MIPNTANFSEGVFAPWKDPNPENGASEKDEETSPRVIYPDPSKPWMAVAAEFLEIDIRQDEAPIILDGPLPTPESITPDRRHSLLKLNLELEFGITTIVGGMKYAVVPFGERSLLGSDYKIVLLEKEIEDDKKARVIAITHTNVLGDVELVGHFDTIVKDSSATAFMSVSSLVKPDSITPSEASSLPTEVATVVDGNWQETGSIVAVHVEPQYRSKNYGRLLWLLALSIHELDTDRIVIQGDTTKDKKYSGQSFYERLGAKPVLFIERQNPPDPKDDILISDVRYCTPTTLSDGWVEYLRKILLPEEEETDL